MFPSSCAVVPLRKPLPALRRTGSTVYLKAELAAATATQLVMLPGQIKVLQAPGGGNGGRPSRLVGLARVAKYDDREDNGKLAGCGLAYYNIEKMDRQLVDTAVLDEDQKRIDALDAVSASLRAAGVAAAPPGDALKAVAQRFVAVIGASRAGKSTLCNSLLLRGAMEAAIKEAHKAAVAYGAQLMTMELLDADGGGTDDGRLLFEALPAGEALTLSAYREMARRENAEVRRSIIEDAKARRTAGLTLGFRGPMVSLGRAQGNRASTYVPGLLDRSPDGKWHLTVPFCTWDDAADAVAAARAEYDSMQAAAQQDGDQEGDEAAAPGAPLLVLLGQALLGGFDAQGNPPARLAGVPSAQWALPAWFRLVLGKTLKLTLTAPSWEAGSEQMHDALLSFTRGPESVPLWAAIQPQGYTLLSPSDTPPLRDMVGALDDGTSRDLALERLLEDTYGNVLAYVLVIDQQVPADVGDLMRTHVQKSLRDAARANPRADGFPPPEIIVLRCVDKPYASEKRVATASLLEAAQGAPAEMRNFVTRAFQTKRRAELNMDLVHCLAVTPVRSAAIGMAKLEDLLHECRQRAMDACTRTVAHEFLRSGNDALELLDTLKTRAQQRSAADAAADAAAVQQEKARLLQQCTSGRVAEVVQEALQPLVDTFTAILEELMQEAADVVEDTPFERLLHGVGMTYDDLVDRGKNPYLAQMAEFNRFSCDSKLLAAMLQPTKEALTLFSSVQLDDAATNPDVLTQQVLDALLHGLRPLLAAGAPDPNATAQIDSYLLVSRLRASVTAHLTLMHKGFACLSLQDMHRALFCCAGAIEHWPDVVELVMRHTKPDGTLLCGRSNRSDAAFDARYRLLEDEHLVDLNAKVAAAMERQFELWYDDIVQQTTCNIVASVQRICGGAANLSLQEENPLGMLGNVAALENAEVASTEAGAPLSSAEVISFALNEVETLLVRWEVKYDTTIVKTPPGARGAAALRRLPTPYTYLTRSEAVKKRTREAEEYDAYAAELKRMRAVDLKQLARKERVYDVPETATPTELRCALLKFRFPNGRAVGRAAKVPRGADGAGPSSAQHGAGAAGGAGA